MLKDLDFTRYSRVYLICGYTDLRFGQTGLVNLVQFSLGLNPFDPKAVFLFCGRKASVIKALVCDEDGMVVMSKRLFKGRYQWPRKPSEARMLTREQFRHLMEGFSVENTIPGSDQARL